MIKKVLATAAAATALVFGLGASAAASQRVDPTCAAAQLVPVFGGSQGAAGTLQDLWRLRNVGHAACRLSGFPVVTDYRNDGRPLPTPVAHLGSAHAVHLAPGQHASFALRYPDPSIVMCVPPRVRRMTIQTQGASRPLITDRGVAACVGTLQETALVHGG